MNKEEVRALKHGDRIQEGGRGGKVGAVESVGDRYLRIRWEGGTYTELDTTNALVADYFGRQWSKLPELPCPSTKGRAPGQAVKRKGRVSRE